MSVSGSAFEAYIFLEMSTFWRHLVDLGRFGGTLKIRRVARNGPKNSIRRLFGTQGRPGGSKKSFLRVSEKRLKFEWEFDRKKEPWEELNPAKTL